MIKFTEKDGNFIFNARVAPRASKSAIVGELDGALKIRIAAAPIDGAANRELVKVLSKKLGVSKSAIEITGGQTSKLKQIRVSGINQAEFLDLIGV